MRPIRQSIRLTLAALRARFNALYMFQVIAPAYRGWHVCFTENQALSWAAQYPAGSVIIVQPKF